MVDTFDDVTSSPVKNLIEDIFSIRFYKTTKAIKTVLYAHTYTGTQ